MSGIIQQSFIYSLNKSLLGPPLCQSHGRRWSRSLCDHYRGPAHKLLAAKGFTDAFCTSGRGQRGVRGTVALPTSSRSL